MPAPQTKEGLVIALLHRDPGGVTLKKLSEELHVNQKKIRNIIAELPEHVRVSVYKPTPRKRIPIVFRLPTRF